MELTQKEKEIIVQLLKQISLSVNQTIEIVEPIIKKLEAKPEVKEENEQE